VASYRQNPCLFVNQQQLVETLHDFVDTKAVVWTPPVEEPMTQPEQVTQPVEKKVETRKRFDPKTFYCPTASRATYPAGY
jgi:hypothetical protein